MLRSHSTIVLLHISKMMSLPVLTPNAMTFAQPNLLPEEDADAVENIDLWKRANYLQRCKDVLWSRWTAEYINSLHEKHNINHKKGGPSIKEGDVVLIQSDERNRGKWNLGIVVKLIKGRDGVVRVARLRARRLFLEQAIQQLCPMELSCDKNQEPQAQPTAHKEHCGTSKTIELKCCVFDTLDIK